MLAVQYSIVDGGKHHVQGHGTAEELQSPEISEKSSCNKHTYTRLVHGRVFFFFLNIYTHYNTFNIYAMFVLTATSSKYDFHIYGCEFLNNLQQNHTFTHHTERDFSSCKESNVVTGK